MTVNLVRKSAVYVKPEATPGVGVEVDASNLVIANAIDPVPLEADEIENPQIRGYLGARSRVVVSKRASVSITVPLIGGGLHANGKAPLQPPWHNLMLACGHSFEELIADGGTSSGRENDRWLRYRPNDDARSTVTIERYRDRITQRLTGCVGSMTLNGAGGDFGSLVFEMQGVYTKLYGSRTRPSGEAPVFQPQFPINGRTTAYPGLTNDFSDCVYSFTLTQNNTVTPNDCSNRAGNRPIEYTVTNRESTAELVMNAVVDTAKGAGVDRQVQGDPFFKSGTSDGIAMPFKPTPPNGTGVVRFGTKAGNTIIVGIPNATMGPVTPGDQDGTATYTVPLTCVPLTANTDYEIIVAGDPS